MEKTIVNDWISLEEYPMYSINRDGQVYSHTKKRIMKTVTRIINDVRVPLIDKHGNNKLVKVDTLVAESFLEKKNDGKKYILTHKDGDGRNCAADNLDWVEESIYFEHQFFLENGLHKPTEYFVFHPLMEFPDSIYEINKMGQVRNKKTGKILKTVVKHDDGYPCCSIYLNGKVYFRRNHIMVARQFLPNPENKPIVNHIDENKQNSCIDNLEWVTPTQNILHGTTLDRANQGRNKPINEYDIYGKYIRTWKSRTLLVDFFDTIDHFNSHEPCIRYAINFNKNKTEQIAIANRVFTFFEGDCADKHFSTIRIPAKLKWASEYNLDEVDVPSQYLVDNPDDTLNSARVLQELLFAKIGFSPIQRRAIQHAIECIKIENPDKT